ncbi:hypothetical protein [Viridibacillus arvi]
MHIFSYHPFTQTELFIEVDKPIDIFTDIGYRVTDEMIFSNLLKRLNKSV